MAARAGPGVGPYQIRRRFLRCLIGAGLTLLGSCGWAFCQGVEVFTNPRKVAGRYGREPRLVVNYAIRFTRSGGRVGDAYLPQTRPERVGIPTRGGETQLLIRRHLWSTSAVGREWIVSTGAEEAASGHHARCGRRATPG